VEKEVKYTLEDLREYGKYMVSQVYKKHFRDVAIAHDKMVDELEIIDKKNSDLDIEVINLKKEIDDLKEIIKEKDNDIQKSKWNIDYHKKKNKKLKEDNASLVKKNKELNDENKKLKIDNERERNRALAISRKYGVAHLYEKGII
jgi:chromosome segregation ATPase